MPQINADGYYAELSLVGGPAAGEVVQKLLYSDNAAIRAAAAETCRQAIFSESTIAALANKLTDPSPKVRTAVIRALALNASWRSETAQDALVAFALNPQKAVDSADRVAAVDGIVEAARLQLRGAPQDALLFKALVALLEDKDEELRTMAANTLAPIRDPGYRGDLGRPEQKIPEGGWQHWVDEVSARAAGYRKDYDVCAQSQGDKPTELFCTGGEYLLGKSFKTGQAVKRDPAQAFKNTLQSAEKGYVPAQNAVALMYANGKGVEQNYAEAAKWWVKAAEAGHLQAAFHASMVYRGGTGIPANPTLSAKWMKYVEEHSPTAR